MNARASGFVALALLLAVGYLLWLDWFREGQLTTMSERLDKLERTKASRVRPKPTAPTEET